MSRIMIVAGGRWQVPLVKKAKKMGHYVLCSNLYEESPAFHYSDECAVANVLDKEKNLEIAMRFKPDIVITDQSDIAVPTCAYINDKLGLPSIGYETALKFTNKYLMRQECKKNGFPCPEFVKCCTYEDALAFFEIYRDIIVKPLDSQSSRGVERVQNIAQLKHAFEVASSYTHEDRGVIAEQYIKGTEFTVDGVVFSDGHKSLAISEKKHFANFPNVASQLLFSNENDIFDYEKLRKQNDELVNSMMLSFGLTHAEYIYSNGEFYLVEIAARGGGTNISSIITKEISGIDTNEILIRQYLGERYNKSYYDKVISQNKYNCAVLKFWDFKPGCVKEIKGEKYLRGNSNILDFEFNFGVGENICMPSDDSRRPGFYIAKESNLTELNKLMNEIESKVDIKYE